MGLTVTRACTQSEAYGASLDGTASPSGHAHAAVKQADGRLRPGSLDWLLLQGSQAGPGLWCENGASTCRESGSMSGTCRSHVRGTCTPSTAHRWSNWSLVGASL